MRGVFLDRDGVINELVSRDGAVDAPFTIDEFRLLPGVADAIKRFKEAGMAVVVISNQPGVAKRQMTMEMMSYITSRMFELLAAEGAALDGVYYCFHHPEADERAFREVCECRKPKPGLLLKAAVEIGIDLQRSVMVGDSITDIIAGQAAGCRTVLIGSENCEHCRRLDGTDVAPNVLARDLYEASQLLLKEDAPVAD